jgi:hypothetical protein
MSEPSNFAELFDWLLRVEKKSGYPPTNARIGNDPFRNQHDVALWLIGYEQPHLATIETAIERLAIHEEEAFQGLARPAAELLVLRIQLARDLIESMKAGEEPAFDYPSASFRELIPWLLIDWWYSYGSHRATELLALQMYQ